jgi:hypothetical protein
MRATFAGNKSIFVVSDLPEAGRFALDAVPPKQPYWDNCREQFAAKIDNDTAGFFFSHEPGQGESVAGFMAKSEEILDLDKRSDYRHTDRDSVIWVEPSRFWMNCYMKRSLLTILLRCGMYYDTDKDNYEEALFGEAKYQDRAREYTQATKLAVMRFMFGFTKFICPIGLEIPTGSLHKTLWVEVFKNCSINELKTLLVAEKPTQNFGLLGADAIWA